MRVCVLRSGSTPYQQLTLVVELFLAETFTLNGANTITATLEANPSHLETATWHHLAAQARWTSFPLKLCNPYVMLGGLWMTLSFTDLFCGGWSFKRQYDAQEAVLQLGMRLWACRSRDISVRSTQLHLAVRERNSSLEKQFWCCLLILLSIADSGCQSTVVLHSNKLSLKKKASFRGCCPRLSRWV